MTWNLDQPLPRRPNVRLTDLTRFNQHLRVCAECSPPVNLCPRGRHLDDQAAASFVSALGEGLPASSTPFWADGSSGKTRARTDHFMQGLIRGAVSLAILGWLLVFAALWLIAQVRP